METFNIIDITKHFVKSKLKDAEGGHDWFHTERVLGNALKIQKLEGGNTEVIALAALLHDIADSKFHNGDESIGPKIAREFLFSQNVDSNVIEHVVNIIKHMSFKNSLESQPSFWSLEFEIVQDADRLDAIGAIGIARCFNYGGFKNRALYNPEIPPNLNMSKEAYKNSEAPTLNHFYEKLLLLKDQMNTKSARRLAQTRHDFMLKYLEQFYKEWESEL